MGCYLKATERGASPYHLAQAFYEGKGCSRFPEKAFQLFVKAAMEGDSQACRVLARLYREETPLGTSQHKSLFYTRLAAQRGCMESKKEFEKHCLDAGMLFLDTELDKIAGQMGQGELDETKSVVAKIEEQRRKEEQILLEKRRREEARIAEEERLEVERLAEEERLAHERKLEAERLAKEARELEEKIRREEEVRKAEAEQKRKEEEAIFAKRLAEQKLEEAKKRQQELEAENERMKLEAEQQELEESKEGSLILDSENQETEELPKEKVEDKLEDEQEEATSVEEEST